MNETTKDTAIEDADGPGLPDDPLGRRWVVASVVEGVVPVEQSCIATLLAVSLTGEVHVLGTAFIVGAAEERALCLCAAHSLEHLKRIQANDQGVAYWYAPPDLAGGNIEHIDVSKVTAFVVSGEKVFHCEVEQINYISYNDLAMVTLRSSDGFKFMSQFAVDFAVPAVGSEVMVLCNQIEQIEHGPGSGQLRLNFHARKGVVKSVEFGRGLPGQWGSFYTTIPMSGGMSGSPIVAVGVDGQPITVLGVVSSDLSPPEAFESFLVAGHSSVAMLWPAFGLGIEGQADGEENVRFHSFADLIAAGFVNNVTSRARVQVSQRRSKTSIVYQDDLHGTMHLETTGHPRAPE